MIRLFNIIFIFCFSLSLSASDIEEGKLFKGLVISYNHGLIKASQKNKFKHLEKYLTKEIRLKTRVWIESYHYSDLFMDALFLGTKFSNFKREQYSASMESNEVWKYRYINVKTKKVVLDPIKVKYKMKYYFVLLKDGSWKINHIKILEEKNIPIKSEK